MKPSLESDENSLILRRRAPWDAPADPHGIAVVGDIHGRLDRLDRVLSRLPEARSCACAHALKDAIITDRDKIPAKRRRELAPLIGKYLGKF